MEELKNDIEQVKAQLLTGIKLGRVDQEWGNMIIETCNRALTIHSVVVPKATLKTFEDLPKETKYYRKNDDAIVWKSK